MRALTKPIPSVGLETHSKTLPIAVATYDNFTPIISLTPNGLICNTGLIAFLSLPSRHRHCCGQRAVARGGISGTEDCRAQGVRDGGFPDKEGRWARAAVGQDDPSSADSFCRFLNNRDKPLASINTPADVPRPALATASIE